MRYFGKEFKTLHFVIDQAESVLLVAHKRPDPDTVGANLALKYYLESEGKRVVIACYDPFPENLNTLFHTEFLHPDQIDLASFDAVIADAHRVPGAVWSLGKTLADHAIKAKLGG